MMLNIFCIQQSHLVEANHENFKSQKTSVLFNCQWVPGISLKLFQKVSLSNQAYNTELRHITQRIKILTQNKQNKE